jgi:hypothetical protein
MVAGGKKDVPEKQSRSDIISLCCEQPRGAMRSHTSASSLSDICTFDRYDTYQKESFYMYLVSSIDTLPFP